MSDKSFISRWSRLKAEQTAPLSAEPESQAETLIEAQPETQLRAQTEMGQQSAPLSNGEIAGEISVPESYSENGVPQPLTDSDMPAIESLSEESDYSQFLSCGVSDELRNLALRKLFNLPQFNIVDGLNDYDEDFSKMPALPQEVVARMRSWLNDKQEQITAEITESTDQLEQSPAPQQSEPDTPTLDSNIEDDELGDADLEG